MICNSAENLTTHVSGRKHLNKANLLSSGADQPSAVQEAFLEGYGAAATAGAAAGAEVAAADAIASRKRKSEIPTSGRLNKAGYTADLSRAVGQEQ